MIASRLVVGIGNRSRGDDGAGPEVVARVASLRLPGVDVVEEEQPLTLVEHFTAYEEVVVVDALKPRGDAGRVHVWHIGADPVPTRANTLGSHGLGVAEAIELARALGRLPRRLTLIGVEAETLLEGAPLSMQVSGHLSEAVRAVTDALRAPGW